MKKAYLIKFHIKKINKTISKFRSDLSEYKTPTILTSHKCPTSTTKLTPLTQRPHRSSTLTFESLKVAHSICN